MFLETSSSSSLKYRESENLAKVALDEKKLRSYHTLHRWNEGDPQEIVAEKNQQFYRAEQNLMKRRFPLLQEYERNLVRRGTQRQSNTNFLTPTCNSRINQRRLLKTSPTPCFKPVNPSEAKSTLQEAKFMKVKEDVVSGLMQVSDQQKRVT